MITSVFKAVATQKNTTLIRSSPFALFGVLSPAECNPLLKHLLRNNRPVKGVDGCQSGQPHKQTTTKKANRTKWEKHKLRRQTM